MAVQVWKGLGYGSVVYMAAILGIDESIYEAAYVDGASNWKRIRYITLPLLKPTAIMLIMLALGGIIKGSFELFLSNRGKQWITVGQDGHYRYLCLSFPGSGF